MASLHVACGIDDWQSKPPVPRVLLNNNYDLNADPCGKKPKCCSLLCKENTLANRLRSKSESQSCKWLECKSTEFRRTRNRTYTYCVRSMHDKAMNVCMMPNNMQELLLDGYQKTELNWQNGINGAGAPEKFEDQVPLNGTFSTIFKHDYDFNQRERLVGVKRSREKSPNLVDTTNNDGIPKKMTSRAMLESEYKTCNDVNPKHCREKTPPSIHCNGLSEYTNGTSKLTLESLDLSVGKCDLEYGPSVKLKNEQNDCDTNSLNDESVTDTFQEAGEETEEECECYKEPLESIGVSMGDFEHHGENYIHSGLRMSLFPNVPPYVKFSTHDIKGEQFPIHIHKLLRWKLSNITPVVVRKVVANSGYRLLKKSTYWGGTWGKHTRSAGFKTLFDYQKMNHFPGTFQIGRKDRLWKSMQKLMLKHGKSKFDLMPTTYILPQDKKQLRLAWKKNTSKEQPWIVKPPASARGTGIKVVHKWNQIPENTPVIVQKYISNPFLINDTKFDLRLYVLVTSMNPLRIYLYDNGLVRFASVKYSTELNTLADRYMHLTNYSINKLSAKYKQNEDASACQGHKWTLKTLWSYMERELNVNVSKLWTRLIDLVIKTILSGEFTVNQLSNSNLGSRYNSYELFGIDVLFDSDLKPWLLEVNISPSLHSSSPLDLAVKAPMVYDLMNIAGFQIPSSKKFTEEQLAKDLGNLPITRLCYDNRLYSRILATSEKFKHHSFATKTRPEYVRKILEDLTPDDVRHLIQYEDELTQLGSFQKIFPTSSTHEYLQYFDAPRYYNMLFDAWETKYHDRREEGIELLRAKCEENFHLKVAKANVTSSKICEIHQKCLQYHVKNQNNTSVDHPPCLYKTPASQSKPKASYTAKPRYRSRYSAVIPSKTYLLRSRKH